MGNTRRCYSTMAGRAYFALVLSLAACALAQNPCPDVTVNGKTLDLAQFKNGGAGYRANSTCSQVKYTVGVCEDLYCGGINSAVCSVFNGAYQSYGGWGTLSAS